MLALLSSMCNCDEGEVVVVDGGGGVMVWGYGDGLVMVWVVVSEGLV